MSKFIEPNLATRDSKQEKQISFNTGHINHVRPCANVTRTIIATEGGREWQVDESYSEVMELLRN